jgi:hypothetical protein
LLQTAESEQEDKPIKLPIPAGGINVRKVLSEPLGVIQQTDREFTQELQRSKVLAD